MRTRLVLFALCAMLLCAVNVSACPCTIWPSTAVPSVADVGPDSPIEVGVSFKADSNGYIKGIRFYKSVANTGVHIAHLWTGTGTLLATATFVNESETGWQQVNFSQPIAIAANSLYVASYHTTAGHYSATPWYFATSGANNPPLHALPNANGALDGPYTYGSTSIFPRYTYHSSNYWVDVVFNTAVTTPAPLQITSLQLPGATVTGAYSTRLMATGGTTPYTWSLASGSLPTGLTLGSTGTISGTPTTAGRFSFTAQVKDSGGRSASATLSINVVTPTLTVAITSPASGASVSGTMSVKGTASDSVSVSSVQVAVDNGSFSTASGTTSWTFGLNTTSLSNGAHTITAKASNSAGMAAMSAPVSITVNNGSLAQDCTLFASPSGNDANSGATAAAPKTLAGAAAATQPGSVVCLLGGTYSLSSPFSPPVSGSPSSWIVYKNYGDSPVNINYTGAPDGEVMIRLSGGSFPSNPAYLEFRGLNLNGLGNALDGFYCSGSHHLRLIGNSISNTGGSGISALNCDYITADHNLIHHNGYIPANATNLSWWSWTSAMSYNAMLWFDNYTGLHNVISNNIVAGEFDNTINHTDGDGIILDLGGNAPPTLVVNNVVYGNGGRCIQSNHVQNFWVVNNTCYKNDLDPAEIAFPSIASNGASNGFIVNNIVYAWSSSFPAYAQYNTVSNIRYYADLLYGSSNNFSYSDASQFIEANPLFVSLPSLTQGGYSTALAPSQLGNALNLQSGSPAYNSGVDASTLSGVPAAVAADLKKYIYTDINGKARPQGSAVDLGAYQH